MLLAYFLLCIALVLCVHALLTLHGRRARTLFAHLPSLPTLPFLGNIHQLLGDGPHLFKSLELLSKMCEETGKPFAAWLGPVAALLVCDPEDVKAITNAYVEKPYYYSFAKDWVGNGLVTAPGHIWKRSIKSLSGAFVSSVVDGYQLVFDTNAARLVHTLKGLGSRPIDVFEYLSYATLETVCQTALGVPQISGSIITREYYTSLNRTLELIIQRSMNIFYHLDFIYHRTSQYKELRENVDVLHRVSETVMAKRKEERMLKKINGEIDTVNNNPADGKSRFRAFLDILLDLGDADPTMTEEQIKSEVDTIIFGGQETVSTTMFMTLLVVGSMPDIQRKMVEELNEIFGDSRRPVEKEDLSRMPYIEAVINETLRLYPPMPVLLREADRDLQIKSCTVPKGVICGVNAWAAGRSTRNWGHDALHFRPERWLDAESMNPAAFLAFSYGRRACIGKKYAYAIMKTILAHILREMAVSSDLEDVQFKVDVSLKAISGHLMTMRQREHIH